MAFKKFKGSKKFSKGKKKFGKKKFGQKKKKFGKKKSYSRSKKTKKSMVLDHLVKSIPAMSYLSTYVDTVQVTGTTNAKAIQTMWGTQQAALQSGSLGSTTTAASLVNLQLTPNVLLAAMMATNSALNNLVSLGPTTQILLRDCSQKCRMTNLSTGTAIVTEYRCRARHDCVQGASAAVTTTSVSDIITNGWADVQAATAGGDATYQTKLDNTSYGSTPFMNPRFVQHFKVLKVKKRELLPGRSIKFGYKTLKPRIVKNEDFNPGNTPFLINVPAGQTAFKQVLKGQTFSVFVAQGTIASSVEATASTNVIGIGNVTLGLIYETLIHYSVISPSITESHGSTRIAGFSAGVGSYPMPIMAVHPDSSLAAGVRTYAAAGNEPFSVRDAQMIDA